MQCYPMISLVYHILHSFYHIDAKHSPPRRGSAFARCVCKRSVTDPIGNNSKIFITISTIIIIIMIMIIIYIIYILFIIIIIITEKDGTDCNNFIAIICCGKCDVTSSLKFTAFYYFDYAKFIFSI